MAFLPQFIDVGSSSPAGQILVLGSLYAALALLTDSGWALAASRAARWWDSRPRFVQAVNRTAGVTLIGLGAAAALSERR